MRAKTDEKRQAIIDAARSVFEEVGYERASMALISARLGGSKATLYGYFQSKEQLFAVAMTQALEDSGRGIEEAARSEGDIATVLGRFGRSYLALVTRPEIMAIQRTVLNDGRSTGIGREVYEIGPHRGLMVLVDFLTARRSAGEIALTSPEVAALHFKGLLEAGVTEPMLYGSERVRDVNEATDSAVDAFMKIYAPAGSPHKTGAASGG